MICIYLRNDSIGKTQHIVLNCVKFPEKSECDLKITTHQYKIAYNFKGEAETDQK